MTVSVRGPEGVAVGVGGKGVEVAVGVSGVGVGLGGLVGATVGGTGVGVGIAAGPPQLASKMLARETRINTWQNRVFISWPPV